METRLNLGCADDIKKGYLNVDVHPYNQHVAVVDLRQEWPWDDSSVSEILAFDIIEHLPDKIHTMNEMWRVLRPKGLVHITVPSTEGPGAFQDPTHVSFWNERSFEYYKRNSPYRERFAEAYGVRACFECTHIIKRDVGADGITLNLTLKAFKDVAMPKLQTA